MIPLSLESLPLAYVVAGIALIVVAWTLGALRSRFQARSARRRIIRCAACGTTFEPGPEGALPRCPDCGHPNERLPAAYF